MSRYVFQMGSSTDGQFFVRLLIYSNRISLSISTLWHVLRLNLHLLFMIAEIIAIKMRTRKKNRFNFSSFLHEVCLSILQQKKHPNSPMSLLILIQHFVDSYLCLSFQKEFNE